MYAHVPILIRFAVCISNLALKLTINCGLVETTQILGRLLLPTLVILNYFNPC